MKYCTHCGGQIEDDAYVCVHCGRKIENGSGEKEFNNSSDVLTKIAKVFLVLACVSLGLFGIGVIAVGLAAEGALGLLGILYFIPLAWDIPLTVHVFKASKENESISTGTKVCILIFANIISGILLLCRTEPNQKN